jgi:uncharacterized protein (TIGR04255 family)
MSSEPLKFPPLQQVAFEINFAPHLRVEDKIADFQDEIKADFPNYVSEIVLRLPTSAHPPPRRREEQPVQPVKTHSFGSLDGQRTLKVSTVNLNLLVLNYLHFDDYVSSASKCLDAALDKFQLREIFRIGLRYINFIKVERTDGRFDYKRYVRPLLADEIERRVDTFLLEVSELYGEKKLTVRSGLLESPTESEGREYVLDFDCFSQRKQTVGPIRPILTSFHDTIEERFHNVVTEGYLHYMRTGQWS